MDNQEPETAGLVQSGMTRAEARALLGPPEASGDPDGSTGIFALIYAWDRWLRPDGQSEHVQYDGPDSTAGTITIQPPPEPESHCHELQVYADYYQFYVQDRDSPCDTGAIWTKDEDTENGLVAGEGLVAISTKRYGEVPVRIEIYARDPGFEWAGIDRVSECSLIITTHLMVGMPISGLHPVQDVAPGHYAVRSLAWGLKTVVSDSEGGDHYIVQLWHDDAPRPVRHLRKGSAGDRV